MSQLLNWPDHLGRTDADDRSRSHPFSVGLRKTERQLEREMNNGIGADEWRLEYVSNDPGIVVRWTKNGSEFAVGCDHFTSKKANMRELYHYLQEMRKSGDRHVVTGQDQFAAAALPGEVSEPAGPPPHEVLNVAPDADEAVIEGSARALKGKYHPDSGDEPDEEKFKRVVGAEEAMLGE